MKATRDELTIEMQGDGVDIRGEDWGDMAVKHVTLPAGTDLGPMLQGLPDDLCPCPHWGQILEGALQLRYADGTEEVAHAGHYVYLQPGHTVRTDDGVVFIEVSPREQLGKVMEHMAAKMAG